MLTENILPKVQVNTPVFVQTTVYTSGYYERYHSSVCLCCLDHEWTNCMTLFIANIVKKNTIFFTLAP